MPEVWVFFPQSQPNGDVAALRKAIKQVCVEKGWQRHERGTQFRNGITVIQQDDAVNVYRRMHRATVAVLAIQDPSRPGPAFLTRPNPVPLPLQEWISLRYLARHKGFFYRLRPGRANDQWIPPFERWIGTSDCTELHDPRVLPLHVFRTHIGWSRRLSRELERRTFDATHGSGGSKDGRRDERTFNWRSADARERHFGSEALRVAGYELPPGFHWDVSLQGDERDLSLPDALWRVRNYVNIAPDAASRGREPHAKRIV